MLTILLAFWALVLVAPNLNARIVQHWSYQELFDKSDLVVIGTANGTQDTREQADLPGIKQVTPDNKTIGVPAIGVETKFEIAAVLKGDKALKEFTLHHYRKKDFSGAAINSPNLFFVNPAEKREFLVFLVREADGRYAPTSGQTDPALYSMRILEPAHGIPLKVPLSDEPKVKR
jgi:hypothetical protein